MKILKNENQQTENFLDDFSGSVIDGQSGDIGGNRFSIVVSTYHKSITGRLLQGAIETLHTAGVADSQITVVWVPGAWEIPIVVKRVLSKSDAVIGLGVVIKGETTHDQYINSVVSQSLGQMALAGDTPIAFGLLTCNTVQQAEDRCGGKVGNKGSEAAQAVVELVRLFDGRLK